VIVLVRHADAVAEGHDVPDPCRYLSAGGRRDATGLGAKLRDRVPIDAVLTSPLARALQTAELLANATGFAGAVQVVPWLAPGQDEDRALAAILSAESMAVQARDAVVVVGHEPSLSALAHRLADEPVALLHKAEAAAIENRHVVWRQR
jgi:phosphohistidine phosphatase